MPPLAPETDSSSPVVGQDLAVTAEALYLANLLLMPGIAFIVLLVTYMRHIHKAPPLAACHLRQTLSASLWAGIMLVIVNLLIIAMGGYLSSWTWMIVIIYFTLCHATLILIGMLGLARAMVGKHYHFPIVGRACHE